MLDGAGQDGVGHAGEGARGKVLAVRERGVGGGAVPPRVLLLKVAPCRVEAAELDRDAGAYADQGGQGALVEGEGPLVLEDGGCCGQGRGVGGGGLEADLDYVEGLACAGLLVRMKVRDTDTDWDHLNFEGK